MGAPGRAYAKVCSALAGRGYTTYAMDLRGTGESGPPPDRAHDFNYDTYLNSDWPAVVAAVREKFPNSGLVLAGHSIGAQLGLVYAGENPDAIRGLLLFTPNTPYYRCFSGAQALRFRLYFHLFPLLVRVLGYFPGDRLGFGGRNAAGVIRDWSYTGRTGLFRGSAGRSLEPAFAAVRAPVAAVSFADDTLAPEAAAENILGRLRPELVTRMTVPADPDRKTPGHFAFMRDSTTWLDWAVSWLDTRVT